MLQRNASRVDRVILAGVEPLDQMLKLPSEQQRLLEVVSRLAAADAALGGRARDLVGSIGRLVEQLQTSPVTVGLTDPRTGAAIQLVLGPFDLQLVVASLLRGPETLALLRPDRAARGG